VQFSRQRIEINSASCTVAAGGGWWRLVAFRIGVATLTKVATILKNDKYYYLTNSK
jgi:hypothetical protein